MSDTNNNLIGKIKELLSDSELNRVDTSLLTVTVRYLDGVTFKRETGGMLPPDIYGLVIILEYLDKQTLSLRHKNSYHAYDWKRAMAITYDGLLYNSPVDLEYLHPKLSTLASLLLLHMTQCIQSKLSPHSLRKEIIQSTVIEYECEIAGELEISRDYQGNLVLINVTDDIPF